MKQSEFIPLTDFLQHLDDLISLMDNESVNDEAPIDIRNSADHDRLRDHLRPYQYRFSSSTSRNEKLLKQLDITDNSELLDGLEMMGIDISDLHARFSKICLPLFANSKIDKKTYEQFFDDLASFRNDIKEKITNSIAKKMFSAQGDLNELKDNLLDLSASPSEDERYDADRREAMKLLKNFITAINSIRELSVLPGFPDVEAELIDLYKKVNAFYQSARQDEDITLAAIQTHVANFMVTYENIIPVMHSDEYSPASFSASYSPSEDSPLIRDNDYARENPAHNTFSITTPSQDESTEKTFSEEEKLDDTSSSEDLPPLRVRR